MLFVLLVILLLIILLGYCLFAYALYPASPLYMSHWIEIADARKAKKEGKPYTHKVKPYPPEAEHLYLTTQEGFRLHAYRIRKENSRGTVVICHGMARRGSEMQYFADRFLKMGYSVLVPDARAHGDSEGKYIGMGWIEKQDIRRWIQLVLDEEPQPVWLFGVSMGAATVMMTSGMELPQQVRGFIEDCGYTNAWDALSIQGKRIFHLPRFPLIIMAAVWCRLLAGYWLWDADAEAQISLCTRPYLMLHGEADHIVPCFMMDKVCQAAQGPKECHTFPDAGHVGSSRKNPEYYWHLIGQFLEKSR